MTNSFDVFDTVLTRVFARPEDLFLEVGRRLYEHNMCSDSEDVWMVLRQGAEEEISKEIGSEKVTIEGIYTLLGKKKSWNKNQIEKAIQIEIETEIESVRPVPRMKNIVQKIHDQGKPIVFFSDMYLRKNTIQAMLEKHGLWKNGDILYVSSEHEKSKYSGKLFELYMQDQNKKPHVIMHYGNSPVGDIAPAKAIGMSATLVPDCNLTRYEKAVLGTAENPLNMSSLIAGISRLSRLGQYEISPKEQVLLTVAADVVAPTLFFFALWCLEEAKRRNIERLYFISRDGQILQKIASQIAERYSLPIECKYLYGSRYAWNNALKSNGAYQDTLGYLLQEGFADGTPSAIIDIGWTGSMQNWLTKILKKSSYNASVPVNGFYFSLFHPRAIANDSNLVSYFSDGQPLHERDFFLKNEGHKVVVEFFLQADHGTVKGYTNNHGIYEASFFPRSPELVSPAGFDLYQKTILYFCTQLLQELNPNEVVKLRGQEIVTTLLSLFILRPTKDESNTIGDQIFSEDRQSRIYVPLGTLWKEGSGVRTNHTQDNTPLEKPLLLNIGCGDRYHGDFINIDLNPVSKKVKRHDIRNSLPFSTGTLDVVYHSHVLEHITRKDGVSFIRECRRVLKPGGVMRLAVPDLERLAASYLNALEAAEKGGVLENLKHQWAILELYDQTIRTRSGGEANGFIAGTTDAEMKTFLESRWGIVARVLLGKESPESSPMRHKRSLQWYAREAVLRFFLMEEYGLLRAARFRENGEIHKWMYDSHALGTLLSQCGFGKIVERTPLESYIPNWRLYNLDTETEGTVVKPDSIYVEGIAM